MGFLPFNGISHRQVSPVAIAGGVQKAIRTPPPQIDEYAIGQFPYISRKNNILTTERNTEEFNHGVSRSEFGVLKRGGAV